MEPDWKVLAASVVGRSHKASDKENEDAVATAVTDEGTVLLALADGAGSAHRSGEGARLAVKTAIATLKCTKPADSQWRAALLGAVRAVRLAFARQAREARTRPRDFACTLLLAAVCQESLAVLQVGDGAIIARVGDRWLRLVKPLRGRYAGETVFVSSRHAASLAETSTHSPEDLRALALLSDGLEPVATNMTSGDPHHPFFEPLLSFAREGRPAADQEMELSAFLASDRVQSRSSDDLSLILALKT